jgi:pyruvate/2-oxoglutarate dehydrogenase complex dihydrolipoamide acyltransferase (E2) component
MSSAAFGRSLPRLMSKRITIPQLSPTHTQARLLKFDVVEGATVEAYDLVLRLECSADFISIENRQHEHQTVKMVIDTQDEGVIKDLIDVDPEKWLKVGTPVGMIDDGEETDGDCCWIWQGHLDESAPAPDAAPEKAAPPNDGFWQPYAKD